MGESNSVKYSIVFLLYLIIIQIAELISLKEHILSVLKIHVMIEIHTSKKNTKFVWASDLKQVLEVVEPIDSWMKRMIDLGFKKDQEYSIINRKTAYVDGKQEVLIDYAIRIEMAKHIALVQNSKKSKALREHLLNLEKKKAEGKLLTLEQTLALIDLCEVLGLFSVQKELETEHYELYQNSKKQQNWWTYRAKLLGYNAKDLEAAVSALGKKYKNQRQAIMVLDSQNLASKYKLIETATIDLFIILGNSEEYSKNLGKAAMELAKRYKPDVYDDVNTTIDFTSEKQKKIIADLKSKNNNSPLINPF